MKRFCILIILAFCVVFPSVAEGSINFEEKSFEELIQIQQELNKAIWNTKKWKKVFAPTGVYEVGVDIPAGKWSIETKEDLVTIGVYREYVNGECRDSVSSYVITEGKGTIDLFEGQYLRIYLGVYLKPYTNLFSFE